MEEMSEVSPTDLGEIVLESAGDRRTILFLDFDGTLVDFSPAPEKVVLSNSASGVLRKLSESDRFSPVIVSGRTRNFLQSALLAMNIDMAAEHGRLFRRRGSETWQVVSPPNLPVNLLKFMPLLQKYTDKVPGSLIENKEFSLTWHYRSVKADYSPLIEELGDEIRKELGSDLRLLNGSMVYEICPASGGKGRFVDWYIQALGLAPGEVGLAAIGDDQTDEEMFEAVHGRGGLAVKVGGGGSSAGYRLFSAASVILFLEYLIDVEKNR